MQHFQNSLLIAQLRYLYHRNQILQLDYFVKKGDSINVCCSTRVVRAIRAGPTGDQDMDHPSPRWHVPAFHVLVHKYRSVLTNQINLQDGSGTEIATLDSIARTGGHIGRTAEKTKINRRQVHQGYLFNVGEDWLS